MKADYSGDAPFFGPLIPYIPAILEAAGELLLSIGITYMGYEAIDHMVSGEEIDIPMISIFPENNVQGDIIQKSDVKAKMGEDTSETAETGIEDDRVAVVYSIRQFLQGLQDQERLLLQIQSMNSYFLMEV